MSTQRSDAMIPPDPIRPDVSPKTLRIWVMHCPFRKTGSPVLGTFGAKIEGVVIFKMADRQQLCRDVPQLQTTQFEVGSYE